ncbi:PepSY domain-containing protein [Olivibacter sp. XZL3]|uniref:PepSY-associated TM helix domain-containing protein n=1 Tax=Olivibacter sp. XZL3 TaxID=1735116 RepID=UPI0010670313|nr:PepSY-associated TM helix domain-containing protein [Olivibacter sp. XZL3]
MKNRNYNIYFHTHTISGIIIASVLYVIFFAGSFSFFKDEISAWQSNKSAVENGMQKPVYDSLLDSLDSKYNLAGRDINFYFYPGSHLCYVNMATSKDTVHNPKANERAYFGYDFSKKKETSYAESYDMGEFLYRLHFLAQLNQAIPVNIGYPVGYLIAGLVAFLFLFALITGLLLHWDKLVSNFFLFRPWSKWKTIWTDLHTVLGVIGFPFQFVFALTGIILIVNTVFLSPFSRLLYKGNMEKVFEDLEYAAAVEAPFTGKPLTEVPDIPAYIQRTQEMWPGAALNRITIKSYGDEGMRLAIESEADHKRSFAGTGLIIYEMKTGNILKHRSPYDDATYIGAVKSFIYRLHLGDYGGYFVKIVNFILGVAGCIVIISGILIWLVARDKNSVANHKRKFNFWLSNIFLAVCLTMLPVTAFSFILIKALDNVNQTVIYQIYFYSWLVLALYYIVRKNLRRTNGETLLLGGVLALLVPVANGFFAGNWIWSTWSRRATDIFLVDLLWLALGLAALFAFVKIKKRNSVNQVA